MITLFVIGLLSPLALILWEFIAGLLEENEQLRKELIVARSKHLTLSASGNPVLSVKPREY